MELPLTEEQHEMLLEMADPADPYELGHPFQEAIRAVLRELATQTARANSNAAAVAAEPGDPYEPTTDAQHSLLVAMAADLARPQREKDALRAIMEELTRESARADVNAAAVAAEHADYDPALFRVTLDLGVDANR